MLTSSRAVFYLDIRPEEFDLYLGQPPVPLSVIARDISGRNVETQIHLSSSDSTVAIASGGLVWGKKPGWATITASAGGLTTAATVTVRAAVVMISTAFERLPVGWRGPLQVTVWHESKRLENQQFAWSSSNPSVATVDAAGVLTAVAPGVVTIDARSSPALATGSITLTVVEVTSVEIVSAPLTLFPGEIGRLSAVALDQQGTLISSSLITWSTSDPAIATISPTGTVTAASSGSARITASSWGRSTTTIVEILPWPALVFSQVAASFGKTCALDSGSQAYCWGVGYLGDSTDVARRTPVRVHQDGVGFRFIDAGSTHACALSALHQAYCWGWNGNYELGNGTTEHALVPRSVAQQSVAFQSIALGFNHTCALTNGGVAWCWGSNTYGQLSRPDTGYYAHGAPQPVPQAGVVFNTISANGFFTCGLSDGGIGYCWGSNGFGQFGIGTTGGPLQLTPVMVRQDSLRFVQLVASKGAYYIDGNPSGHVCGLTANGQAYCWGYNGRGALGDSSTTSRTLPTRVRQGSFRFRQLTTGEEHTCAVTESGDAYCWGSNEYGALGIGTSTAFRVVPTPVLQNGVRFSQMSAGSDYTCGVATTGSIYCWGNNAYGQLGDGTKTNRFAPVPLKFPD